MSSYCELDSLEFKQLKTKQPMVYGNPVWTNFPDAIPGAETDEETMFRMKEIYAMADNEGIGYLGRRQFKDLLGLLGLDVDDDMLYQMFNEMDADGNGQIEFDEFATAMINNIGKEQLEQLQDVRPGAMGTRMWTRGQIIWGANTGLILITVGMACAGLVFFEFILIPVMLSYFFVFLVAPLMDLFEHRPLECGEKACCDPMENDPDFDGPIPHEGPPKRYRDEARREMGGIKAVCYDIFTLGRVPHGLSVLLCVGVVCGGAVLVVIMVYNEVTALTADTKFMGTMETKVDEFYESLNSSGIKILRNIAPEGHTEEGLASIGDTINTAIAQVGLIFLLTLYIMGEKVDTNVWHNNIILEEIEAQVKYYIVLKSAISLLTGILVGVILISLQVKLALMFGLLSFLLNYIPNVGSMIAMMLPIPIILVDPEMESYQIAGAIIGPGIVQGYVGNVLEPTLFGKALNMTALSILAALAIWGAIWGITGAVLSVPLLAVQKICLMHANHPLAKTFLMCIREDATIDENEASGGEGLGNHETAAATAE